MTKKLQQTREEWLNALIVEFSNEFKAEGIKLPKYRVTCGFPSARGLSSKLRTVGECWYPEASSDKTTEIIMSITEDEPVRVAGVVLHEMIHATLGRGFGHGKEFRKIALACGLVGKMTATEEGPEFIKRATPILLKIGVYNHGKLDPKVGTKKQSTRMKKHQCLDPSCGAIWYASRKWFPNYCPVCSGLEID